MIMFFIIPQSFKPDDVDSGIGKSDDNATAAANAGFPHEKEVEMVILVFQCQMSEKIYLLRLLDTVALSMVRTAPLE